MSKEFIEKEIEKVFKSYPSPLNMAMTAAWVLGNLKGQHLRVLDVKTHSTLADYYVLASSNNPTQANAMVDEIARIAKKHGLNVLSIEGRHSTDWVLIDLGPIIVHIFSENERSNYNLDGLYKDAKSVEIPEEYYFSTPESVEEDEEGYF